MIEKENGKKIQPNDIGVLKEMSKHRNNKTFKIVFSMIFSRKVNNLLMPQHVVKN